LSSEFFGATAVDHRSDQQASWEQRNTKDRPVTCKELRHSTERDGQTTRDNAIFVGEGDEIFKPVLITLIFGKLVDFMSDAKQMFS